MGRAEGACINPACQGQSCLLRLQQPPPAQPVTVPGPFVLVLGSLAAGHRPCRKGPGGQQRGPRPSHSCLASALRGPGTEAGARPFGSHLLHHPLVPGQVLRSLGTPSSFAGRGRERGPGLFSHLLHHIFPFFLSHAAEQKVRPPFSPCPWEAVYQDWVRLQDVCFIFPTLRGLLEFSPVSNWAGVWNGGHRV